MYIYVYVYIYMYLCIYIYIYVFLYVWDFLKEYSKGTLTEGRVCSCRDFLKRF